MGKNTSQLLNAIIISLSFFLWVIDEHWLKVTLISVAFGILVIIFILQTDWFALKFLRKHRPSFTYIGKWEGFISYERFSATKKKEMTLNIRYTKGNLEVIPMMSDVASSSITRAIYSEHENSLMYTYLSKPSNLSESTENPIHYGAVLLKLIDRGTIQGNYFTSRKSGGTITLKKVSD